MKGLVTALKQTSRRRVVAITVAAGALAGASFAFGVRVHDAHDLQKEQRRLNSGSQLILQMCVTEHRELSTEREELFTELKSGNDSIKEGLSTTLHHTMEPWILRHQMNEAWHLQWRVLQLFRKTCSPMWTAKSETDIDDESQADHWQSKALRACTLLQLLC